MERSNTERVLTHRHNTENNLLSQISNNKKTTRYISTSKIINRTPIIILNTLTGLNYHR